jgi:hypothetical protein
MGAAQYDPHERKERWTMENLATGSNNTSKVVITMTAMNSRSTLTGQLVFF